MTVNTPGPLSGGRWVSRILGANGTIVDGEFVQEVALEHLRGSVSATRSSSSSMRGPRATPVPHRWRKSSTRRLLKRSFCGQAAEATSSAATRSTSSPPPWRGLLPRPLVSWLAKVRRQRGLCPTASRVERASRRISGCQLRRYPRHAARERAFGYKRGAFSGADRDKIGIVRAADGGTLFLDEIGDMPRDAQAKLLGCSNPKRLSPSAQRPRAR